MPEWSYDESSTISDLNKDGTMEIIYHDAKKVYVTDLQGNMWSGFPRFIWDEPHPGENNNCAADENPPPYCYLTQIGVADLDQDGFPDIYGLASNNYRTTAQGDHSYAVFAFDRFGNTIDGFPYYLINEISFPAFSQTWIEKNMPTVTDLDNDGVLDMITSKGWGRIEAFRLNPSRSRTQPINIITIRPSYFPQYGVNAENTKVVTSGLIIDYEPIDY